MTLWNTPTMQLSRDQALNLLRVYLYEYLHHLLLADICIEASCCCYVHHHFLQASLPCSFYAYNRGSDVTFGFIEVGSPARLLISEY